MCSRGAGVLTLAPFWCLPRDLLEGECNSRGLASILVGVG